MTIRSTRVAKLLTLLVVIVLSFAGYSVSTARPVAPDTAGYWIPDKPSDKDPSNFEVVAYVKSNATATVESMRLLLSNKGIPTGGADATIVESILVPKAAKARAQAILKQDVAERKYYLSFDLSAPAYYSPWAEPLKRPWWQFWKR